MDIEKWIRENTFRCELHGALISFDQCEKNYSKAIEFADDDMKVIRGANGLRAMHLQKCLGCKQRNEMKGENMTDEDTRVCKRCNEEKPIEQFMKNPSSKTGYNHVCKECAYARQSETRKMKRNMRQQETENMSIKPSNSVSVAAKSKTDTDALVIKFNGMAWLFDMLKAEAADQMRDVDRQLLFILKKRYEPEVSGGANV